MEPWLISLTTVAFALAIVMTWVAWRVLSQERERSQARIAALVAALDDETGRESPEPMFSATARPSPRSARWALAAVAGLTVVGLAVGSLVTLSTRGHESPTGESPTTPTPPAEPLELVSLRHERTGKNLVVKGLVRNPVAGRHVNRLTAVVFLFDRRGTLVGSGRALVDFLALAPGDESPFVVEIPVGGSVGRYRVSFRTEGGGMLPHVDRRSATEFPSVRGSTSSPRPVEQTTNG